jgi:hypothetical protein
MTMLPDIDQSTWDDLERERVQREMEQRIQGFTAQQAISERIASLPSSDALTNPLGSGNALPEPETAELPAPAAPAPTDFGVPRVRPTPAPAPAIPTAVSQADWIGQALGAVSRAGGDVQAFASNLRTDAGNLVGSALGAASLSGADMNAFASSLPAPPPTPALPLPPARPSAPLELPPAGAPSPGRMPDVRVDASGPDAFIRSVTPAARYVESQTGIPAEAMIGMAALETGYGKSAPGNNLFGIKGSGPAGSTTSRTQEDYGRGLVNITDQFRRYDNATQSFQDFVDLLQRGTTDNPDRYKAAFGQTTVEGFVGALKAGGYMTDPNYVGKIKTIVDRYRDTINQAGGAGTRPEGLLGGIQGVVESAVGAVKQKVADISQFGDQQLTADEAYAACGPAAAVRFANVYGRNPTLREATDIAKQVGWNARDGMAGITSEQALMDKLGVPTTLVKGAQWNVFAKEAQTGNPVTISTENHYFFADGYDPSSGAFHVGRSGTDLKNGAEWMTPAQMTAAMGPVQGALLADNPQVPAPSTADQDSNPLSYLGRVKDTLSSSFSALGERAQEAVQPLTDITGRLTSAATGLLPQSDRSLTAAMQPTPSDVLTNPLGTGNQATQAPPPYEAGLPPRGSLAVPPPPEGPTAVVPALGQARDALGEAKDALLRGDTQAALGSLDQAREAVATSSVGPLLGMLRGPGLVSDEELLRSARPNELEAARQLVSLGLPPGVDAKSADVAEALRGFQLGQAAAGTHTGPGGAPRSTGPGGVPLAPATGAGMLQRAITDLGRYPEELTQRVLAWAGQADAPASSVASAITRWMEENPVTSIPSRAVASQLAPQVVADLETSVATATGRGGGGRALPGGAQPGQLGLPGQEVQPLMGESGGGFEVPELPATPATPTLEQLRMSAEQRRINAERAARGEVPQPAEEIPRGPVAEQRVLPGETAQPPLPAGEGAFEVPRVAPTEVAPPLKLPAYIGEQVSTLLEDANRFVSHAQPVSQDLLQGLASKTGETAERIRKVWKPGAEGDAVLRSASRALDDSAADLARAQDMLKLNPADAAARADVIRGLARHQALQEALGGRRPDAGAVLRDLQGEGVAAEKATLEQITSMAKRFKMSPDEFTKHLSGIDMRDPDVVASVAKVAQKFTFGDYATALWYFNLLSQPLTHVRNIVGNTLVLGTAPVERAGAAAWDPVARRMLGDTGPRQRYFGEAPAMYYGMAAAAKDAGRAGLQALRYPVAEEAGEIGRLVKEPFAGKGPLEAIGFTNRALGAEDVVYRGLNFGAEIHAEAYRRASQAGLKGEAFRNEIARLVHAPDDVMLENAKKQAAYRVFQQRGDVTSRLNTVIAALPGAVKGVVPFIRTPVNMAKYTLERSPLGAAGILRDFSTAGGREGLRARGSGELAERLSRTTIGSLVMYGAYQAAQGDNLTGRLPRTKEERDAWERQGKTPYSFRNPLDGKWVSYRALQPYVPLLGAAADIYQAVEDGTIKDDRDIGAIFTVAAFAAGRGLLDTQWTQGASELLDLMNNGSADPQKDLARLATQYASNVIPAAGLLRSVARMTDNAIRDPDVSFTPEGIARGVAANLPGVSQMLPADLNAFGYPRERPTSGLEAMLNPVPASEPTTDPVELELLRVQEATKGLPKLLGGYTVQPGFVGKDVSIPIGKDASLPVQLTDEQQRHYQELSGRTSYALLSGMVGTRAWNALSDAEKAKQISQTYQIVRTAVLKGMQPELLPQGLEDLEQDLPRGVPAMTRPQAPVRPTAVPVAPGAGG